MTPLFPAQRAAEEFDQVLAGSADPAVVARYAELFDAVEQLRTIPEVSPRADFVGDLRSRLMTAAETELVPSPRPVRAVPQPQERTHRRNRRIGTIAASLVVVGGTAGMAAAASGALPGEQLYPIKRGIEQVTTAAHFGDASQGRALLDQAATRLEEVRALQAQGSADPDLIAQTVDDFNEAADSGSAKLFDSYQSSGDQADISTVRDFTAAQMADINDLATASDTATNDLLGGAADTLADIDAQARDLCGPCGPATQLTPPEALGSGAGAATVATLIARPVAQAQADAKAAAQAQAKELKQLQATVQAQADAVPLFTPGTSVQPGTSYYAFPGSSGKPGDPLTSALSPDGKLLPTLSTGVAVKDLVSGLKTTLDQTTGGATAPVTQPLNDTVKKLGDTVDETTDQLLP